MRDVLPEAVSVEAAGEEHRREWDEFATQAMAATLYHRYLWRGLIEDVFGHPSFYFLARGADGGVRGILPLVRLKSRLFGDFLVSVPYFNYGGVVADSPAARHALLAEASACAERLGVSHVELRHRGDHGIDWRVREDKVSMLLDLPSGEEQLWKMLDSKLRSQIRRPQKEGASVREGGAELIDDFYAVFSRNMRDLGTPVYPKRFFNAVMSALAEAARLFVVDLQGHPVAAGLVLSHRSTVEIPWASSLREANRYGVNMLLYWSVLRAAVLRGFKRFDFGRSSRDSGTYKFKAQWGAKPEQLHWHYWLARGGELPGLTPSNPKYRAAIALWQKLPVPVANVLGPRIVKNLP